MGNTSSTPPPLIALHAHGARILVPRGTNLYAQPPSPPGSYYPPYSGDGRGAIPLSSVYRPVSATGRVRGQKQCGHRREETDANLTIREYVDDGSTELGELAEFVERKTKGGGKTQRRKGDKERSVTGPFKNEKRQDIASARDTYIRGGRDLTKARHGLVLGDAGIGNNVMPADVNHGMTYRDSHLTSPQVSPLPVYIPHYSTGFDRQVPSEVYARNPYPRPTPPSIKSPPSMKSPPLLQKTSSKRLPPSTQTAISAAVQRSIHLASPSKPQPTHPKLSPAATLKTTHTASLHNDWIDNNACICTNNCKCRKGEHATGWYEGVAEVNGNQISVRGRLNTRWVMNNDLGKDCRDFTTYQRSDGSSPSASDIGISSLKAEGKGKKEKLRGGRDEVADLRPGVEKIKKAAALQRNPYYPSWSVVGHGSEFDVTGMKDGGPDLLEQQHARNSRQNPYSMKCSRGMYNAGRTRGAFAPISTRNSRAPRMPPRSGGMWRQFVDDELMDNESMDDESVGDDRTARVARKGSSYTQPGTREGRVGHQLQSKPRSGFGLRGDGSFGANSVPHTYSGNQDRGKVGSFGRIHPIRGSTPRPDFASDDSVLGYAPRRRSNARHVYDEDDGSAVYKLSSKQRTYDSMCVTEGVRRGELPRISPPGRCETRDDQTSGKQAHVETDGDEND